MIRLKPAIDAPIGQNTACIPYVTNPTPFSNHTKVIEHNYSGFWSSRAGNLIASSIANGALTLETKPCALLITFAQDGTLTLRTILLTTPTMVTAALNTSFDGPQKCFFTQKEVQALLFPHEYPPLEAPNTTPVLVNDKYAYPYSVDSQEENFLNRPSIRITIPDHLKNILVDDWENVTKNLQLVPLPSKMPANFIIDTYFDEEKSNRRLGSAEADLLEEFCAGLKVYFDKAIGKILLYRFERRQLAEVSVSTAVSVLYNANFALSTG